MARGWGRDVYDVDLVAGGECFIALEPTWRAGLAREGASLVSAARRDGGQLRAVGGADRAGDGAGDIAAAEDSPADRAVRDRRIGHCIHPWMAKPPSTLSAAPVTKEASSPARDRQSVVEGKSVSVRVDLGGRRI